MSDLTRTVHHSGAGFRRGERVEFRDDGPYGEGGWTRGTVQSIYRWSDGRTTLHIDADTFWRTVTRSPEDVRSVS